MKSWPNLSFCCCCSKEAKINTATEFPWAVTDILLRGKSSAMVTCSNAFNAHSYITFSKHKQNPNTPCVIKSREQKKIDVDLVYIKCVTCWFLKGCDSILKSSLCLSVGTSANLWEESCHVEDNAGFFQRDVLLAYRHASEGVIPIRTRTLSFKRFSYYKKLLYSDFIIQLILNPAVCTCL